VTVLRRLRHLFGQAWLLARLKDSKSYWDGRYRLGLTSGCGSEGALAEFKARVLNGFVREQRVGSVIEFGCGDGTQLALAAYPRYLGLDVSPAAIRLCRRRFAGDATKEFRLLDEFSPSSPKADLTLSLDVIYHLLEDAVYHRHLEALFGASRRWVIIYSSNAEDPSPARHVRHRRFTDDVSTRHPAFGLVRKIENPYPGESFAEFYVFERLAEATRA
jgi:SAM-dependent methyltransferase